MKLRTKKLKTRVIDPDATLRKPKWMMTNPAEQRQALKEAAAMSGRNRPPELWIKDGEEKSIRSRLPGPVACLWRYTLHMGGDKWMQVTMPEEGEVDLLKDQGLTPQLRAIYDVIDVKGFVDKKGKRFRNVPRFFNCNSKMYEQLETIRKKRGPLCDFNIDVSRTGTRQTTTYVFLPDTPSPMTAEMKAAKHIRGDFAKFYAPPTEQEQEALLRRISRTPSQGGSESADDEDDE